jgi:flagella basal body P-ring formation protein FlgA
MALLTILLVCCLQGPAEITLDADTFTIGDLFPIPAGDPRARVALGTMPAPGLARRITKQEVESRLRVSGLGSNGLAFPESILVRRRAAALDVDQVTRAVRDAFERRFPNARIELLSVEPPQLSLPIEGVTIDASLPERFDPKNAVFARLDVRGRNFSRIAYARVQATLEALQPVLLAALPANNPLTPDLVEWRMETLDGSTAVIDSIQRFEGMLAKRSLSAGQVLASDLFYLPLFVRKGEIVTVRALSGNVSVTASMRARAAGSLGDTVSVEHISGGPAITARIVGPRLLEVIQK